MACPRCGCPDVRQVVTLLVWYEIGIYLMQCEGCKHVWAA